MQMAEGIQCYQFQITMIVCYSTVINKIDINKAKMGILQVLRNNRANKTCRIENLKNSKV